MQGKGARQLGGKRLLTVGSREPSDAKACRKSKGKGEMHGKTEKNT